MYNPFRKYQEEEKDGTGTGGTGDGKDEKPDLGEISKTLSAVTQAVTMLASGHDELKTTQGKIAEALEALKPKAPEEKPITPESLFEGIDLTGMDNAGLAKLVVEKATAIVEERLGKAGKETDSRINSIQEQIHNKDTAEAVKNLKDNNPDFFEWTAEMRQLIAQNPTLNVRQAYVIAKAEHPEKSAAMTKKYAKPLEAKRPVGLLPTSVSHSEGAGKMSKGEAALAAFDATFGAAGLGNSTNVV